MSTSTLTDVDGVDSQSPMSSLDDPMHQVIPHLWLGDYLAANSPDLLRQHGITHVISAIRWKPQVVQGVRYMYVEVDDTPEADLLAHLPACVSFISDALSSSSSVLVHCQAGVSRSATIVVAYLMSTLSLSTEAALELVRAARPQACPSEAFLKQLGLWKEGGYKVSRRDKATRRWYMGRTAQEVMNGDGSPVPLTMLASWPMTPTASAPTTPLSLPKRRIRCRKCRRELATREHMLDHNVGPGTQPSTPGVGGEGDPMETRTSLSRPGSKPPSRNGSRRSSSAQAERPILSPLSMSTTSLDSLAPSVTSAGPGMPRRRSSASSPLVQELPVPTDVIAGVPPLSTPTIPEDSVAPPTSSVGARPAVSKPSLRRSFGTTPVPGLTGLGGGLAMTSLPSTNGASATGKQDYADSAVSEDDDDPLPHLPTTSHATSALPSGGLLAGSALNASLPPALAALRSTSIGTPASLASTSGLVGVLPQIRKRSFNLQMSRIDPSPEEPQGAAGAGITAPGARVADRKESYFSPPILANSNCSGYFLEPMKWMDFLEEGEMGGAIYCPNKKCNAKLGNYDWAGVKCGCKEWIVPGFCIHKSKVDEDL
ncbi:hypothetical protein DACRYDRAFT_15605 [Dacryopinax primogenitus]|uniref:protein-tyrosine-phosphatase n=1 Tax=Dacryopinax primogenitus (strain DJM 731) TaxID=1858805 RepID=M5G0L3_DACPD|nr:uncharacterized protein DACRYDRAFT_15605 [Dacryopinax primogenitus]EJU02279.1 hypothetical protein DACRYDRAFT_15605 [Dacryopinax primogenitus]